MKFTKFFVLLIICSSMIVMLLSRNRGEEHIIVYREMDKVIIEMPMEEYLLGMMAATISPDCEPECQKAMAVLLRSRLESQRDGNQIMISGNDMYYDYAMRKEMYGTKQEEKEEILKTAIDTTSGMIAMSYNGTFRGDFHALSAGMTRGTDGYPGVYCMNSMEAENFFFQKTIAKEKTGEIKDMIADEEGYVQKLWVNGEIISGELFRLQWGLPSANFEIKEAEKEYVITARGMGHGFGMDLYYANELAKQGYTYDEILQYFFKDMILKKIIV